MKIVVASTNPVKIKSVRRAFGKCFPRKKMQFSGLSVPSGVKNQPMSEIETLKGATNRVENARRFTKDADFYIGIEGGIEKFKKNMMTFAWVVTSSKDERVGMGRTASFFLPKRVRELVENGYEMGDADDVVFGRKNSKQANGAIGLLTNDIITRMTLFEPAVIISLIPFIKRDLY